MDLAYLPEVLTTVLNVVGSVPTVVHKYKYQIPDRSMNKHKGRITVPYCTQVLLPHVRSEGDILWVNNVRNLTGKH